MAKPVGVDKLIHISVTANAMDAIAIHCFLLRFFVRWGTLVGNFCWILCHVSPLSSKISSVSCFSWSFILLLLYTFDTSHEIPDFFPSSKEPGFDCINV